MKLNNILRFSRFSTHKNFENRPIILEIMPIFSMKSTLLLNKWTILQVPVAIKQSFFIRFKRILCLNASTESGKVCIFLQFNHTQECHEHFSATKSLSLVYFGTIFQYITRLNQKTKKKFAWIHNYTWNISIWVFLWSLGCK